MKPGRNDPCPCGSGKKYKHCCLNAGTARLPRPPTLLGAGCVDCSTVFRTKCCASPLEAYGPLAVHEAWDEFTGLDDLEFDPNTPLMQLFMPWFFNCWAPDPVSHRGCE